MKTSKRILYFVAFVTTVFYLTWRLVATIPWHDSWFALIFGILLWGSEVQPLQATFSFGISKRTLSLKSLRLLRSVTQMWMF